MPKRRTPETTQELPLMKRTNPTEAKHRRGILSGKIIKDLLFVGVICLVMTLNSRTSRHLNYDEALHFEATVGHHVQEANKQCRIYWAESGIVGAGLGLWTAVPIKEGEEFANPVNCIPTIDAPENQLDTHSWSGNIIRANFEGDTVRSACEGFGAQPNNYRRNNNFQYKNPRRVMTNPAGVHRAEHPSAGSFSHYFGMTPYATMDIEAGSELTTYYGGPDFYAGDDDGLDPEPRPKRTKEWFDTNGFCVDHMKPGISEIPQAGRGAFARHNLPEGTVVHPAPIMVFSEDQLTLDYDDDDEEGLPSSSSSSQLLMNYVFKHPDVDMFFYPTGLNLINHDSKRPNVMLRWSTHPLNAHGKDLLTQPINTLKPKAFQRLITEVVAIRDIQEGEEIVMDYGREWEEAWETHVKSWKPPPLVQQPEDNNRTYKYLSDFDKEVQEEPFLRTLAEQEENPYPRNLGTVCVMNNDYKAHANKAGTISVRKEPNGYDSWPDFRYDTCAIISREEEDPSDADEATYTAVLLPRRSRPPHTQRELDMISDSGEPKFKMSGIPRHAIWFIEKPYTGDQHLANAFRHPIGLPDEMIPPTWRRKTN